MELEKQYDAKTNAKKIYLSWEGGNHFRAHADSDKPSYCIVMPPPNVTGVLHMGHALVDTLQDILIRWKRMSGFETLWVPGTDHAGIATQTVVERHLIATQGKRRKDFEREEFVQHIWDWKAEKEGTIVSQLKALGLSCDWSRYRFTMDDQSNRAVRTMFKKMFDDGLIYQGDYLVNWDPVTQTALADDEVEYIERTSSMWTVRYPLEEGGEIHVATTRPETMLGDTAVAVHPQDDRYRHLIGKLICLPLTDRKIPVIGDETVEREFGTGAVKITPAHDPNDYQMGERHRLEMLNIMTPGGCLNEVGGKWAGLKMEEARLAIAEELKSQGFLVDVKPHVQRVGISYRSKAVIEPYISKQWFIKMGGFAKKLRAAVDEERLKLVPDNWKATYFHWVDNLRDWCISRQLWWGHRIPIWHHKDDPDRKICFDGQGVPPEVAAEPDMWEQDPDALDTWFSSGLWPFSTLGWPDKTPELDKFYPNAVLVTGHDILFFWIARMVLMGEYAMGEVPFHESFIHGLIYGRSYWTTDSDGGINYIQGQERKEYDLGKPVPKGIESKWEKLSKSKGNVINPLDLIDEYGCDAVRMALCASSPQNLQIDLDRRRLEEFKNFTNKVWNGARFVFMNLEITPEGFSQGIDRNLLQLDDKWILSQLNRRIKAVNEALTRYSFDHAAQLAYDFFWKEFCAYYVEGCKPFLFGKAGTPEISANKQRILAVLLLAAVRMLHPITPYITEELFGKLKERFAGATPPSCPYVAEAATALAADMCIVAPYPTPIESDIDEAAEAEFEFLQQVVYTIRNIRGEMKLPATTATDLYFNGPGLEQIEANQHLITSLVRTNNLHTGKQAPFGSTGVVGELQIVIPVPPEQIAKEIARLEKELEKLKAQAERIQNQLRNESYVARAPAHLVEKTRADLAKATQEITEITSQLNALESP